MITTMIGTAVTCPRSDDHSGCPDEIVDHESVCTENMYPADDTPSNKYDE